MEDMCVLFFFYFQNQNKKREEEGDKGGGRKGRKKKKKKLECGWTSVEEECKVVIPWKVHSSTILFKNLKLHFKIKL